MRKEEIHYFHWNEDTLDYFTFMSNYSTREEVEKEVKAFVKNDCFVEDSETEEMLVEDLISQIFSK